MTLLKQKKYLLLLAVLALGVLLRLYKVDNPIADWHSWRQADTASVAKIYLEGGIDIFRPRFHDLSTIPSGLENPQGWRFVEFPVFNIAHALFARAFPQINFDTWGRLTAIFFSTVSGLFIFLIAQKMFSTKVGLVASFFFAVLPFNVYFSRVVLPEPVAVALALAGLYFFIVWIEEEKFANVLASAVFFSLSVLVKPFAGFYLLPALYLAVVKYKFKIFSVTPLWVFLCIIVAPFLYWRGWMWQEGHFRGIPHWKWILNGDEIRFRPAFWWWIFGERLGRMILGTYLVGVFIFGAITSQAKYKWFLQTLLVSQLVYLAVFATGNVRHDYYQTIIIPAVAITLGVGTALLWNLKSAIPQNPLRVATALSVVFGLFISLYQIKEFYKVNHPEIILAGQAVQKLTPKDAKVIAPYMGDTAFLYQTGRRGWPHVTLPIQEMVEGLGAEYYVSVNYDDQTRQVMNEYQVLEQNEKYVVVKLEKR